MPVRTDEVDLDDITEGDTAPFTLFFEDETGAAIDISGWDVTLTIKHAYSDADSDAIYQQTVSTHDDAANGETSLTIDASTTDDVGGNKVYDIQVTTATGDVHTVARGRVYFGPEVTQS